MRNETTAAAHIETRRIQRTSRWRILRAARSAASRSSSSAVWSSRRRTRNPRRSTGSESDMSLTSRGRYTRGRPSGRVGGRIERAKARGSESSSPPEPPPLAPPDEGSVPPPVPEAVPDCGRDGSKPIEPAGSSDEPAGRLDSGTESVRWASGARDEGARSGCFSIGSKETGPIRSTVRETVSKIARAAGSHFMGIEGR